METTMTRLGFERKGIRQIGLVSLRMPKDRKSSATTSPVNAEARAVSMVPIFRTYVNREGDASGEKTGEEHCPEKAADRDVLRAARKIHSGLDALAFFQLVWAVNRRR